VEVGHQAGDDAELVTGVDEELRAATRRHDAALAVDRQ
jgi:hypothetical protein